MKKLCDIEEKYYKNLSFMGKVTLHIKRAYYGYLIDICIVRFMHTKILNAYYKIKAYFTYKDYDFGPEFEKYCCESDNENDCPMFFWGEYISNRSRSNYTFT